MIDINELRRLTQAATPGPWHATKSVETNSWAVWSDTTRLMELRPTKTVDMFQVSNTAAFIAAANPAAVKELLDRLEAAEKAVTEAYQRGYATGQEEVEKERDALRAKIERMEQQEPVKHEFQGRDGVWYPFIDQRHHENTVADGSWPVRALYALPGAQPAPSISEGWIRAIDEALVVAHIGVANASDTYEQAKAKLDNLIGWHVDVATDPAVNGGWRLVPIEPTHEMREAGVFAGSTYYDVAEATYETMLAAAPEAKPCP